jgi:signal transduction histidine kinase
LRIAKFQADEQELLIDSSLVEVEAGRKRFLFDFSTMTLLSPQKIKFKYKLEGFDNEWIEVKNGIRQASYTNLTAGNYTFRVTACNEDGIWSKKEEQVTFRIKPFIYQTLLFRIGLSSALIFTFFGIYQWRTKSIQRRNQLLSELIEQRTAEIREKSKELESQKVEIEIQKTNISQQKEELEDKNKELSELNEEKNQLISILAHDLKSPLAQIKGLLTLYNLSYTDLNEEQKNILNMVGQSADRMQEMILRILDVKAIESKKLNINLSINDISVILLNAIETNKVLANKKDILIEVPQFETNTLASIDINFLLQVYDNLLSNAIKFSPKGSIVRVFHQRNNGKIRTVIKDEGQGLTPEDKSKLFRKFQTLSARPTGSEVSTGLGLSIVKRFVEEMEGSVWCESEYKKGASFFVEFKEVKN